MPPLPVLIASRRESEGLPMLDLPPVLFLGKKRTMCVGRWTHRAWRTSRRSARAFLAIRENAIFSLTRAIRVGLIRLCKEKRVSRIVDTKQSGRLRRDNTSTCRGMSDGGLRLIEVRRDEDGTGNKCL